MANTKKSSADASNQGPHGAAPNATAKAKSIFGPDQRPKGKSYGQATGTRKMGKAK